MFPQTRLLTEKASNWLESMSLAIRVLKAQRTWKGTVLWLDRIKAISCGRARILSASNGSLGGLSSCCTSKLLSLRGSKWRGLMVSAVGAEAPFLSTAGFVRTNFFQPSLRGGKKNERWMAPVTKWWDRSWVSRTGTESPGLCHPGHGLDQTAFLGPRW